MANSSKQFNKRTRKILLEVWEAEWIASTKGRITHQCFPSINVRTQISIVANKKVVEVL